MTPATAYLLGLVTLPVLWLAWGIVGVGADFARELWSAAKIDAARPAWISLARAAGWNRAVGEDRGFNVYQWRRNVRDVAQEARRAVRLPWCPRLLWVPLWPTLLRESWRRAWGRP